MCMAWDKKAYMALQMYNVYCVEYVIASTDWESMTGIEYKEYELLRTWSIDRTERMIDE